MQTTYPLTKTERAKLAEADQAIQRAQQIKVLFVEAFLARYDIVPTAVDITDEGLVVTIADEAQS